ncbi:MAG: glycosyltransferase family 2 protein, partial [Bacteroidetes bacterium]|nr:glycosyltransferase family 2 protein [Bacteroidota bacterium]
MLDLYSSANPLVSVIMATYNRSGLLQRSIPSFINQIFKDCELIVVDDGSNDNSFEIVNHYMKHHE